MLVLAGCSTPPVAVTDTLSAGTCSAHGGTMRPVGRAQTLQCVLAYADAGKVCTDSSQCQGECLAEPFEVSAPSRGRCAPTSDRFGCRTLLVNGVAQPTICRD